MLDKLGENGIFFLVALLVSFLLGLLFSRIGLAGAKKRLKAENEALQADVASFKSDANKYKAKSETLETENHELKRQHRNIFTQKHELQKKLEDNKPSSTSGGVVKSITPANKLSSTISKSSTSTNTTSTPSVTNTKPIVEKPTVTKPVVNKPTVTKPIVTKPKEVAKTTAAKTPILSKPTTARKPSKAKAEKDAKISGLITKVGKGDSRKKDDLKVISGVGPTIEKKLNGLGIYNYHQVAKITKKEIAVIDELLAFFPGRIERDNWIAQAKKLAKK